MAISRLIYDRYMYPDREDIIDRRVKKIRKQEGRGDQRADQGSLPMLPMPGSRNILAFDQGGGSANNILYTTMQDSARPNEPSIAQYEQIPPKPYEQCVPQTTSAINSLPYDSDYTQPFDGIKRPSATGTDAKTGAKSRIQSPAIRPADGIYSEPANPAVYHQQPEQEPDTLHRVPLNPEEPVYINH